MIRTDSQNPKLMLVYILIRDSPKRNDFCRMKRTKYEHKFISIQIFSLTTYGAHTHTHILYAIWHRYNGWGKLYHEVKSQLLISCSLNESRTSFHTCTIYRQHNKIEADNGDVKVAEHRGWMSDWAGCRGGCGSRSTTIRIVSTIVR